MAEKFNMAIDIGGTNTRIALACGPNVQPKTIQRYKNDNFPTLYSVITQYITDTNTPAVSGVCACIAGPVSNGVGTLTNRDWHIDRAGLTAAANADHAQILNDMQAQGHSLSNLSADQITTVIKGRPSDPAATKLVVNVGTGFNSAVVYKMGKYNFVPPAESGHVNLPIRTDQDVQLGNFLAKTHGFPAVEDILSGRGLENAYAWLSDKAGDAKTTTSQYIMDAIVNHSDSRAIEAGKVFSTTLGAVCGNLALTMLPFGGLYLVGGMARAFTPYLDQMGFSESFYDKGRFSDFLADFSIYSVEDDYAALSGCASYLANS